MKFFIPRSLLLICASFVFATIAKGQPDPGGFPSSVQYNPQEKIVEGNQPLTASYVLQIIAPSNLPINAPVTVNLALSVLSKPATGVTDAEALSFISLSPTSLTFTGPSQALTTTVTVTVPLGNYAGDYAYKILPSGWPVTADGIIDAGATVNAIATPPNSTDTNPPAIILLSPANGTEYIYAPLSGIPVTVPVSFSASVAPGGQSIDSLQLFIGETLVTLNPLNIVGLGTISASATASIPLITPGSYTITAGATNENGTSWDSADITVVVDAPPPTITPSSPVANSNFSFPLGGAGASVPVSFSAISLYGNITALSATLNGSPVTLNLSGVGSATTATSSTTLTIATPGIYNLVFSASNEYGAATPVTIPFTVTGVIPAPTVSILTPANGSNFSRVAGDPATVVNYTFEGGTSYGTVTSVIVTLDGLPVSATVNGLNTASITGSGSLSFTAGGSHTLNVTLSNGGATASASTSFTVTQTQPPTCRNLMWLPPISLNKTIQGGSTMPIKFTLTCHGKFVRDTSVLIAIYEVFRDGSTSTPVIYPYGVGSPNPPDYAITGKMYHLNFRTATGVHSYRIEVYSSASGTLELLGSKELNTKGKKKGGGHGHDDDDDCHDRD